MEACFIDNLPNSVNLYNKLFTDFQLEFCCVIASAALFFKSIKLAYHLNFPLKYESLIRELKDDK